MLVFQSTCIPLSDPPIWESHSWELESLQPDQAYLELKNTAAFPIRFQFTLNGESFFQSITKIAQRCMILEDKQAKASSIQNVWHYLLINRYHFSPLTDLPWYNHPFILLNSTGWGYCDDVATAACYIWEAMGYESRVWWFSGHVVPEVNVEGNWELYDPDLGVYYTDEYGTILGVKDLIAHSNYITNPIDPVNQNAYDEHGFVYSEGWATMLQGKKRAFHCNRFPSSVRWAESYDTTILLPPASTIRFPKRNTSTVAKTGLIPEQVAQLQLEIPAGYAGSLHVPLILTHVEGKGWIQFETASYIIPSKQLSHDIETYRDFHQIREIHVSEQVTCTYLLNPLRFTLQPINTLQISSPHLEQLEVLLEEP